MPAKCRKVAILGAGVAGLASVKSCLEEGMEPVGFESRSCIGGVWSNTNDQWSTEGPAMYQCLVTNTSKSETCFSDFPCPANYPPYMPHWKFQEYLESYADHFLLKQHYRFNTRVKKVMKSTDHDVSGAWQVFFLNSEGQECEERFDGVVACTGFYVKAWKPDIPGLRNFKGRVLHANEYKTAAPFLDRTVLVIGNASSAGDISCDISNVAKQVYLGVASGCCVLRRTSPSFVPPDMGMKRIFNELLPLDFIVSTLHRKAHSMLDHKLTGLIFTGKQKKDCPILLNDDLGCRIISGKIKIVRYTKEFSEDSFLASDEEMYHKIDDVIFCTGYHRDLSILDSSLNCDGNQLQLYKQVFPLEEKHHTLAIVGCIRAIGPMPPTLELQARLAAYTLSGRHQLPTLDVMRKDVNYLNELALRPDGTYRYSYLGIFIQDNIAAEIGVKPKFWKLLLMGRPGLAFKCFFGSIFPFHYRLFGPGVWQGAESAMDQALLENLSPLRHASTSTQEKRSLKSLLYRLFFYCGLILTIAYGVFVHNYQARV